MCCLLSRRIKRQAMSCVRWCFTQGAGRDHGTAVLDMLLTAAGQCSSSQAVRASGMLTFTTSSAVSKFI